MVDLSLLGNLAMYLAVIAAALGLACGIAAGRSGSPRQLGLARAANLLSFGALSCASAILVYAFVTHDFTLKYVHQHSDRNMPLFYTVTSFWGGMEGSLLFWVWILSIYAASAVRLNWQRHKPLMPWIIATLQALVLFFSLMVLHLANPFDRFLIDVPHDGAGLNPLLQNYYMVFHPPALYLGYVGFAVPFAFAVAALCSGRLDEHWLRSIRRWTLVPWMFLLTGLTLGGLWAYEELGWGGYWAWDPVENAAFMPWLTGTALIHSVMLQERRGMLKVWNVSLVVVTFVLTLLGTYLTRSGVVQSVHAFAKSDLGVYFFSFILVVIVFSVALVLWRLPLLRSRGQMESFASRDFVFLLNNWILLAAAFFVLFGTMWPTISEAIWGESGRVTVGPPFFNKWMVPIGIVLLFLTGVGPLLSWRRTTRATIINQFTWPGLWLLVIGAAAFFLAPHLDNPTGRVDAKTTDLIPIDGADKWFALACFALCGFVASCLIQEFTRGSRVRRENRGVGWLTALVGLVGRQKRRYGGYVVHFGLVIMFCGFAGNAFNTEATVDMTTGQETTFGSYRLKLAELKQERDAQKTMVTAAVELLSLNGDLITMMHPARWFYEKAGSGSAMDQNTNEIHIRRGAKEDLYVVLGSFTENQAQIMIRLRPLTSWVWVGYLIVFIGMIVVLWPERKPSSMPVLGEPSEASESRAPADHRGARVVASGVVLALALGAVSARAQHVVDPGAVAPMPRTALEQELLPLVRCMCGGCNYNLADCVCHYATEERELYAVLESGVRRAADANAFVDQWIDAMRKRGGLPGANALALSILQSTVATMPDSSSTHAHDVLKDAMLGAYIKRYGGMHVLTAPIDKGFQRFAWAVPYAVIVLAMALVLGLAWRWIKRSRNAQQPSLAPASGDGAAPPAFSQADRERLHRLEDELAQID